MGSLESFQDQEYQVIAGIILEKLNELKRIKKGYNRYKIPQTITETQERIEDLEDFLNDIPSGVQEFQEYEIYFKDELAKWNAVYQGYLEDEEQTKRSLQKRKKRILTDSSNSSSEQDFKKNSYQSPPSSESEEEQKIREAQKIVQKRIKKKDIVKRATAQKYLVKSKESLNVTLKCQIDDLQEQRYLAKKQIREGINLYTLIQSEQEIKPKKSKRLQYDSDSSMSDDIEIRGTFIKLGCGHHFKKRELKDWIEQRTDGLVQTIQEDEVGLKFFKCKKCYYLITAQELEKIFGRKKYNQLNQKACQRRCKFFDSQGNLKKEERKERYNCMLCDANTKTKANHDDHYFCKQCWQGVNQFYKGNFGCCGGSLCPYFNQSITSRSVIHWIQEKRSEK